MKPASRVILLASSIAAPWAWAGAAVAQPTGAGAPQAPSAEPVSPETELARRHFANGVKLYSDGNFSGSLAEFEAAYRLKPGPSSLKNIALSQKALFRYSEAAESLEQVLSRHAAELSDADRRVIRSAIDELASLVGTVVLRVNPPDAKLSVGGKPAVSGKPIRLNVGEHTVVAEAPGHARESRVIRVAGGQKDLQLELNLTKVAGFVRVKAQDPEAAIAIDGVPKGLGSWSGWLQPGAHAVQVYRAGFEQFQTRLTVELGKNHEIVADPLVQLDDDTPATPDGKPSQVRGWYGLLAINGLSVRNDPADIDIDNAKVEGGAFGVRAGYRVWTPVAVELLLEGARHDISGACDKQVEDKTPTLKCGSDAAVTRSLQLESTRLGPNLRIMSSGEHLRFTSTLGAGAVRHALTMDAPSSEDASVGAPPGGEAKGWDPYFLLEVGAQFNAGHILLEVDGLVYIDGASNVKGSRDDGSAWSPYADTGGLIMGGIGVRGGWSEWSPQKKR